MRKLSSYGMAEVMKIWEENKGERGVFPLSYKMTRKEFTKVRLRETINYALNFAQTIER